MFEAASAATRARATLDSRSGSALAASVEPTPRSGCGAVPGRSVTLSVQPAVQSSG
jgi:hypothetical protein